MSRERPTPGDEAAFTCLYERDRRPVYAYLLGRTGNAEAAEDLLQEAFLRVWRHLAAIRGLDAGRQRAWVFAVARNLAIDAHRSRTAGDAAMAEFLATAPTQAPGHEQPVARAEMTERMAVLDTAIRALPEPLRVVLALHTVGELTSAQVGELTGEPAGTVRYRLSAARRQLADALRRHEEGQA